MRRFRFRNRNTGVAPGGYVFPTISSMFTRYEADYEENVDGSVSYNFAPSDVNTSTNRITITGLPAKAWVALTAPNGTPLYFSSTGTLPGGLVADTPYYLKLVAANTFEVYPENTDNSQPGILPDDEPMYPAQNFAQSTNIVDLTTQGTGTHTVYSEDLIKILKDMQSDFDSEAYDLADVNSYFERFTEGGKTYIKQRAIVRDWSTGVDARSGKLYPQGPAAPTGPTGYRSRARAAVAGARYVWHCYVMRPLKIEIHGAKKASGNTSAIDTTNDVISTQDIADGTGAQNHGLATGDEVKFIAHPGSTLPGGLSESTTYYVRIGDQAGANTTRKFRVYPTLVDANADTNKVNLTDTGGGTWTVYAPKRAAESVRHSRFLLEQLSPDSSSDALSPQHLEDPIQCNITGACTSIFAPGSSSNGDIGGPGLSLQGNRKGDRVYVWYPPESTPPTRSDTGQPLTAGYYYISYRPSSTNMVRLHDTNASAVGADGVATASLADDGDAVGGCIKYSATGGGEVLIQSAWLDGVGPGVAMDNAAGGSKVTFSDVRLPQDFCVVVYLMDYEPDDPETNPQAYVYLNGALIEQKDAPTTGGTKGRLSGTAIEDQAAWKFGNSSAGHVCADADYVAVYLGAETGDTSPEEELLDLMEYAIARWSLSAEPVLSINRTSPSISGSAVQGETLSGDKGRWNGYPLPTFTYRWLADGVAIFGATGLTYVLTASEVGKEITFEVTANNLAGDAVATSAATSEVLPPVSAPSNTVAPVVSGNARVGDDLTCTTGTWVANPAPPTYTYQWVNSVGGDISGATSNSYTLQATDEGDTVYCRVTATNTQGAVSANSNSTGTVAPAPALSIPVHSVFVALGDQITAQSTARGTRNWVNWTTFLLNGKLRPAIAANQGKNGDTMTAMNTRIANITGQAPAVIFLNCGRGDGFSTALATLQTRLDTLLASIWGADSSIIVIAQAALPASGDNGTALTRIADFNTYLAAKANLSGSNRLVYAPVPTGWDPTDGVHTSGGTIPNTAGAYLIAKALVAVIGDYVATGDVLSQTTAFGTFGANADGDYSLTGTGGTKTATAGTVTGDVADGKEVTNLTTADIACSVSSGVQTLTISGTATATTVQFDEAAGSNASISVPSGYYAESLIGVTISAADGTSAPVGLRSFIDNIGQGAFGSTTADTGYGDLPEAVTGVMRTWPAFSTTTAASLNAQIQFLLAAVSADVKVTLTKPIVRRVDLAARHTPFYVGGDTILTGAATCRITGTLTVGSTLTCGLGTWSGSLITYTYQWKNNTVDISGATSATYVVQAGDSGDTITCVVTATNSFGATSQTTAGVVIA